MFTVNYKEEWEEEKNTNNNAKDEEIHISLVVRGKMYAHLDKSTTTNSV